MYHPMLPHATRVTIFVMRPVSRSWWHDIVWHRSWHRSQDLCHISVTCGDEESCHDVTIPRPHTWRRPWHRSRDGDHDTGLRPVLPTITNTREPDLIFVVTLKLSVLLYVHMDDALHDNDLRTPDLTLVMRLFVLLHVHIVHTVHTKMMTLGPPTCLSSCNSSSKFFCCCCKLTKFVPHYLILQWRPSGREISVPTLHFPIEKCLSLWLKIGFRT